jgi:hypothetical protein
MHCFPGSKVNGIEIHAMNIRVNAWLFLLSSLVVTACGWRPAQLTEQEKQNVSKLTQNLKPHCVGRYLIDTPADALVSGSAIVQGVRIDSTVMSKAEYLQEVASRSAELRGKKSIDLYPFFYADDEVDGPDTHYSVYRGNLIDGSARRVFEAYKWDRGYRTPRDGGHLFTRGKFDC